MQHIGLKLAPMSNGLDTSYNAAVKVLEKSAVVPRRRKQTAVALCDGVIKVRKFTFNFDPAGHHHRILSPQRHTSQKQRTKNARAPFHHQSHSTPPPSHRNFFFKFSYEEKKWKNFNILSCTFEEEYRKRRGEEGGRRGEGKQIKCHHVVGRTAGVIPVYTQHRVRDSILLLFPHRSAVPTLSRCPGGGRDTGRVWRRNVREGTCFLSTHQSIKGWIKESRKSVQALESTVSLQILPLLPPMKIPDHFKSEKPVNPQLNGAVVIFWWRKKFRRKIRVIFRIKFACVLINSSCFRRSSPSALTSTRHLVQRKKRSKEEWRRKKSIFREN